MRREAYQRSLLLHLFFTFSVILMTNMVVAAGVSAANLRIVSNASSLIADYMEVDGGEESSTDWGIGRMLIPNNDPTTGHIVYPVVNDRREFCNAYRYQSCLPPGNPSKPRGCKDPRDRTC